MRSLLKIFNPKQNNEIHKIDKKSIEHILKTQDLTLMNFSAEWCCHCLLMNGILKEFISNMNALYVTKINTDTKSDILKKYGIRGSLR